MSLAIARSLVAAAPPGRESRRLLVALLDVSDDSTDPLAVLPSPEAVHGQLKAVVRLLSNRNPHRFDSLYDALSPQLRAGLRALSPLRAAGRLHARVELASSPHDKYFPPDQSRALARRAAHVRLTVTPTLQHAVPRFSAGDLAGIIHFDGFVVRVIRAAR